MSAIELMSLTKEDSQRCDNITFKYLPLMDHWAYSIHMTIYWTHISIVWICALVRLQPVKMVVAWQVGIRHTCLLQKWTSGNTRSGTMVQMPRMPRTANTNRLWSVTAYARASWRPTDTGLSIYCRGEELPYLECRWRSGWKVGPSGSWRCMS